MKLTAKDLEALRSRQVITKKRVLADKLQELSGNKFDDVILLREWPVSEILNEIRLRMK